MKRYGNLYESVCTFPALLAASRKARKGKRFKTSAAEFEFDLENNLIQLEHELRTQTYCPGAYREFFIYEPKKRKISAAPYRDRVVQHSLCHIIEPIFDRSLIFDTYACRTGKGTHRAVDRFTAYARKFKYVLKCDAQKYFPSIDHEILKTKIRRKIKCGPTLRLIDTIIDSSNPQDPAAYYFPGDELFTPHERPKGIPIGNLTSQIFANLYLSDADHFIKEKYARFGYIRYMDDMAVFGNSRKELWQVMKKLENFLVKDRIRLQPNKGMLYPVKNGVNYLGYKVYPDHRRVRYENTVRYRRRLKKLQKQYHDGKIALEDVRASVHSWIGHVKHADSWRLRQQLLGSASFTRGGA